MPLPHPNMEAVPFTPLTAEFLDDMNDNIASLSGGDGLEDSSVSIEKVDFGASEGTVRVNESGQTLVDERYKYIRNDNAFTPAPGFGAPTSTGNYIVRDGRTLYISFRFIVAAAFTDTSQDMLQVNLSGLGIGSVMSTSFIGQSDGGNSLGMLELLPDGIVRSHDWQPSNLSIGSTVWFAVAAPIETYI